MADRIKDSGDKTAVTVLTKSPPEFKVSRRHLPHHIVEGSTYFLTVRIKASPLNPREVAIVLDHIKSGDPTFYDLIGAVVMPDHIHLLLRPNAGLDLSRVLKGIKGAAARKINLGRKARGVFWQDETFDRVVRDQQELEEKFNYMVNNPVKRGLAEVGFLYEGCYFKGYEETVSGLRENQKKLVELKGKK